jgi:hypothetical protein
MRVAAPPAILLGAYVRLVGSVGRSCQSLGTAIELVRAREWGSVSGSLSVVITGGGACCDRTSALIIGAISIFGASANLNPPTTFTG